MGTLPRHSSVAAAAALLTGAVLPVYLAGWPESVPILELIGVVAAALLTSALRIQHAAARDRAIMPPSFVITFAALLLFGPQIAVIVALAGALMSGVAASDRAFPRPWALVDAAVLVAAAAAAGAAYRALGGTAAPFSWPWQGVPIAAAVIAHHLVHGLLNDVIVPFAARSRVDRAWPARAFRGCPVYLLGATVAAGVVELVDSGLWEVLPVAAGALFLACGMYADYAARLEEDGCRREVMDSLEHGMAVLDRQGRVTLWNDVLERMLGCPCDRVMGRPITAALSLQGRPELPRAIPEVQSDGKARTVDQVKLSVSGSTRTFQVKVLRVAGGVALLWHDVTARVHVEHEMKRAGERLALAAEAANDGLWQWDLRTQEFYVSGRWRGILGLAPQAGTGRAEEWLERVHPDDVADLKATLEAHLAGRTEVFQHEHRIRHEDGNYRRVLCRALAVKGTGGRRDRLAGSLTDTTEQSLAQERLRSVGFLDPLTGLFNRAVFVEGLGRRLEEFRTRRAGSWFAVLYLDLDRFKIVNDSLGHLVGDELLIAASRRLEACLRPGDELARLGGDEFAILLNGLAYDAQANAIALRIQESLGAPFSIGGREVFTSASIGIAFGPAHYTDPDDIMRDADTAMYHAKARGKARHEVFDDDMHARVRDRLSLENDLRRAVTANDFEVHYQPIVSLTTGMCVGFESLVRWTRNGEPVSPATFIPIAEELGLVETIGTWVLQQACVTFAEWQRRFPGAGLDCITVNVSSRQLMQHNFLRVVQDAVRTSRLRPADLRVEITETALMDSPGEAAGVLRDLRDFGVKVYLDDFGTGYSSLSHLHKLPVDALKIDRSFVKSLLLPDRPAIVESILALARTLNTSVVAEGIETEVQARELERLGCTHAQGFLFSRPLSTKAAEELVMARQPLGPKAHGANGIAPPHRPGAAAVAHPVPAPRVAAPFASA